MRLDSVLGHNIAMDYIRIDISARLRTGSKPSRDASLIRPARDCLDAGDFCFVQKILPGGSLTS